MFLFLIFGLPLSFLLLFIRVWPREEGEDTRRTVLRGLVVALPLWFVSRFFGSLFPVSWGTPFLTLHEWVDRTLPYAALPALSYAVFWRYSERLERGSLSRKLTAFYAACLSPVAVAEAFRMVLSPDFNTLILLPLILATIVLALPLLIQAWFEAWTLRRVLLGIGFVLGSLALSSPRWFLLSRGWPLALLLVGLGFFLALRAALPRLQARRAKLVQ